MSMAMISPAPLMRAPWITLRPTPPHPMTATESPLLILAVFIAAPVPVSTPQPMRAATFMSMSSGILTAPVSGMMEVSEKVPDAAIWNSGAPCEVIRGVPSSRPPEIIAAPDASHR